MLCNAVHPLNVFVPILVTPAGIVTAVSEVQFSNAFCPMVVTVLGNVGMLVKELHPLNMYPSSDVIPEGRVTFFNAVQLRKAFDCRVVTESGIVMLSRTGLLLNAEAIMRVTLFGIVTLLSAEQLLNAAVPISVNPCGISIEVSRTSRWNI